MGIVNDAVVKAGGVNNVSRKMNVSTTSVSNWMKDNYVPPNRILEFEAVTGVERCVFAPDLFAGYHRLNKEHNQFIPDINDAMLLLASHLIEKANLRFVSGDYASDFRAAMISLHDVSKVLGMNDSVSSALYVWSDMLGSSETKIFPIDYDLMLERGSVDPIVIHRTFSAITE